MVTCNPVSAHSYLKTLAIAALSAFTILSAPTATSPAQAQTGVYTQDGGTGSETNQTYAATAVDQSAVYVLNSGILTLTNCTMTKTGDASDVNASSQYGTNAGVLAKSGGMITMLGSTVTTNASGANGIFASGTGSAISMSDGFISTTGAGAHGVDATYGGSITLNTVTVTTSGTNSSAIATDFGGGVVTVTNGAIIAEATASGSHSAGIYSTGAVTVTGATVWSFGDCGGVIDGANSITLLHAELIGQQHGIKIWKTAPAAGSAVVTMREGWLTSGVGSAFYVTDEAGSPASAEITVKEGASVDAGNGNILSVLGASSATLTLDGVELSGSLYADAAATATVTLQNSAGLAGAASGVGMAIDASSVWFVTSNSVLTSLADSSGVSGSTITNIVGNGYDVHYDPNLPANSYLGGLVYTLVRGGVLTPDTVPVTAASWGKIKTLFGGR
jgi:hypothetical protein